MSPPCWQLGKGIHPVEINLSMYSSSLLREWILESSNVDQPLEVGNELGAYDAFLFCVHVVLICTAVDGWNLSSFVENISEAAI